MSITPDGDDPRVFAEGGIEGRPMHPDDIAFDDEGNLFVSDSSPTAYPAAAPSGRVLRFDRETAEASVLADHQPNPNGISFDLDGGALWVSRLDANRIDRLTLSADATAVTSGHDGRLRHGERPRGGLRLPVRRAPRECTSPSEAERSRHLTTEGAP